MMTFVIHQVNGETEDDADTITRTIVADNRDVAWAKFIAHLADHYAVADRTGYVESLWNAYVEGNGGAEGAYGDREVRTFADPDGACIEWTIIPTSAVQAL